MDRIRISRIASLPVIAVTLICIAFITMSLQAESSYAANTSISTAKKIGINKWVTQTLTETDYYGNLNYVYYKFKTSKHKRVKYKLCFEKIPVKGKYNDCYLSLVDINNNYISNYDDIYSFKPNSWHYLKLENDGASIGVKNRVKVQRIILKPARGKIYYIKGKKNKLYFAYKRRATTTRYEYRIRRKYGSMYGNWSSPRKLGKKLAKTVRKLRSGTRYQVQVRACRRVNKKWYRGKWSVKKSAVVR
jgi:hypothetical protein